MSKTVSKWNWFSGFCIVLCSFLTFSKKMR